MDIIATLLENKITSLQQAAETARAGIKAHEAQPDFKTDMGRQKVCNQERTGLKQIEAEIEALTAQQPKK